MGKLVVSFPLSEVQLRDIQETLKDGSIGLKFRDFVAFHKDGTIYDKDRGYVFGNWRIENG